MWCDGLSEPVLQVCRRVVRAVRHSRPQGPRLRTKILPQCRRYPALGERTRHNFQVRSKTKPCCRVTPKATDWEAHLKICHAAAPSTSPSHLDESAERTLMSGSAALSEKQCIGNMRNERSATAPNETFCRFRASTDTRAVTTLSPSLLPVRAACAYTGIWACPKD